MARLRPLTALEEKVLRLRYGLTGRQLAALPTAADDNDELRVRLEALEARALANVSLHTRPAQRVTRKKS